MKKNKLIITLFGSTGDLTAQKILPSIADLLKNKYLPEDVAIFALGRRNFDSEKYLNYIKEKNSNLDIEVLKKKLGYLEMDISDLHDFLILKNAIKTQSDRNTVFVHFLALSQELAVSVSESLSLSEIVKKGYGNHRIIFEKPFGNNLKSAKVLKHALWKRFDENQIYRIDHYLGKELVKKINQIKFEDKKVAKFLENEKLEKLSVIALEDVGILERGAYYDGAGATKDMVQNHLLQLVSVALMSKKDCQDCNDFIDEKVAVLKSLKLQKSFVKFGQYKNYFKEKNVSAFSKTETLAFMSFKSRRKDLKEVKIDIIAAKKAGKKLTEIVFEYESGKRLEVNLFPDKAVKLVEGEKTTKVVGCKELISDYASLILDAYKAEKRHFVRFDEIESSWSVVDKALQRKREVFEYDNSTDIIFAIGEIANKTIVDKIF